MVPDKFGPLETPQARFFSGQKVVKWVPNPELDARSFRTNLLENAGGGPGAPQTPVGGTFSSAKLPF